MSNATTPSSGRGPDREASPNGDAVRSSAAPAGARPKYKRKLSNYLLNTKLQLPYLLFVTLMSAVLVTALGWLIYDLRHTGSESLTTDLQRLSSSEFSDITNDFASEEHWLIFKMAMAGVGMVVVLSGFLIIMTHKVAGPLYKVTLYFDKMATGRLDKVWPLRKGDMLQDFYQSFSDMHHSVRARFTKEAIEIDEAVAEIRELGNQADYRGKLHADLLAELDKLEAHQAERKKQLA